MNEHAAVIDATTAATTATAATAPLSPAAVAQSDEVPDMPQECPLSHRVARRVSTTIILFLVIAILALGVFSFLNH